MHDGLTDGHVNQEKPAWPSRLESRFGEACYVAAEQASLPYFNSRSTVAYRQIRTSICLCRQHAHGKVIVRCRVGAGSGSFISRAIDPLTTTRFGPHDVPSRRATSLSDVSQFVSIEVPQGAICQLNVNQPGHNSEKTQRLRAVTSGGAGRSVSRGPSEQHTIQTFFAMKTRLLLPHLSTSRMVDTFLTNDVDKRECTVAKGACACLMPRPEPAATTSVAALRTSIVHTLKKVKSAVANAAKFSRIHHA